MFNLKIFHLQYNGFNEIITENRGKSNDFLFYIGKHNLNASMSSLISYKPYVLQNILPLRALIIKFQGQST